MKKLKYLLIRKTQWTCGHCHMINETDIEIPMTQSSPGWKIEVQK